MKQIIPTGWYETKLEEVCTKISDGIHTTPKYSDNDEYYFINGNNLTNDSIATNEHTKCVSKEEYEKHKKDLNDSTILLSINGTIGNTAYFKGEKVILGKSAAYINCGEKAEKEFIFFFLKSSKTRSYFTGELTGSTIKNLSLKSIKDTPFLLPPLPEQHRIVAVLETWDKAIEKLSKKIKIKKKIKKGLMQKLITGKVRLPEFSEEWKPIKIGNFLEEISEQTTENNQYPMLTSARGGIFLQEEYFKKQVASQNNIGYKVLRKGKFTYRAMTDDGVFVFNRNDQFDNGVVSPAYAVFEPKNINSDFLLFIINTKKFNYEVLKYAQGGTRRSLKFKSLRKVVLNIPDIEEQNSIALFLNTFNKELFCLERKRDLLKKQKTYLLNNLVTGRIRTPENLKISS